MSHETTNKAVCPVHRDNTGYKASLIRGKVYRLFPDSKAAKDDLCASSMKVVLGTHSGTHVDAPLHFIKGGRSA